MTFLSHVERVLSEESPSRIRLRSWLRCWTAFGGGPGVGRAQRGEQAVEELPPIRGSPFDDADVVREEGNRPYTRATGGVVRE
jgi:hypothetical protein